MSWRWVFYINIPFGLLAGAIQGIFVLAFVAAAIGLAVTMLAPGGRIAQLAARRGQSEAEKAGQPVTLPD
ncbi:MAG TPA: hypothetical protein VF897_21920 [Roseiflexaceae bacterium]